ncbi:MAG: adenosylcobalamin-dependent ribonucleoside-diphosphate reductase [Candidatus Yanofskybacteria bacterium]|nr:adenosylcobalamin-dependent ribonucleoside-diphosphate reductase [Candidatus Yanofskybacteria bacterium]
MNETQPQPNLQPSLGEVINSSIGIKWPRLFGTGHPYDSIKWEKRTAKIVKGDGTTVFEQKDVEVPSFWTQTATDIVASKYFRGKLDSPDRETSVKQMIDRVAKTIGEWGMKDGYFETIGDCDNFTKDLTWLLVNQQTAFNSPVWFNVGVYEKPQASACYILAVEDNMQSILDWYRDEGWIFKFGSGSGINLSKLRSSKEPLSKGGYSSGPVSFMKGADGVANSIRSGGTTRRAAKMVVLNVDHPDVREFISSKKIIEDMTKALAREGFKDSIAADLFDPYTLLPYQNANNSVRVTDAFMRAVEADGYWDLKAITNGETIETVKAKELLRHMADAAWHSADPGIQYDTTFNEWHTCPNAGRINATNPCSEYAHLDNSACNLASLNLMKFLREGGRFDVESFKKAVDTMILAQDILVDRASYPTEKITVNAHAYRQLGLGYANLGSLLMTLGMPYDSNEGRILSGQITSLMCGEAYRMSAVIASHKGPFAGYYNDKEGMLGVLVKHRDAGDKLLENSKQYNMGDKELETAARLVWHETKELADEYGVKNSQVTVLAPTGCLVGDSLILTDRGLVRLQGLGDPDGKKWQPLDIKVATDEGPCCATKFFVNGVEPIVSITTSRGYRIKGTTTHRIRVVNNEGKWQWRRFSDLKNGDRVPMMLGGVISEPKNVSLPPLPDAYWTSDHKTSVPRNMTPDLAEIVGYFMGDGSLHSRGLRFCVTNGDYDVIERLTDLGRKLFGLEAKISLRQGYTEVALHSVRLTLWWEACGFTKRPPRTNHWGKGYEGHIPDAVLYSNDPVVYRAFIRGLFEADGTANHGYVAWSTVSEQFARDIQTLLLALGFVTTHKIDPPYFGKLGTNASHVIRLLNVNMGTRFLKEIGFISNRKKTALEVGGYPQAARFDLIPVDRATVDRLAPSNDNLRKTLLLSLSRHGMVTRRSAEVLYERTRDPELTHVLGYFYDEISVVELGEEEMTYDISVPSNVTYVANGFVSHNTISFLMDCDTTGIEPELALVKYKKLVGGGTLKLVNNQVPIALRRLGYLNEEVDAISEYILEKETIEGAPYLKEEHLPIFDCSFKSTNGARSISYMGHIRMMAAAQPFISGAISKTVNLPSDATVEDIEDVFFQGWRLGLKALAVYRDGCKSIQPLNTSNKDQQPTTDNQQLIEKINGYTRIKLPDERPSVTHKFSVGGFESYLTVGFYPDTGKPGETFITTAKEGSTISGLFDTIATLFSMCLQSGIPLKTLVRKFKDMRFEPSGFTNNPDIPTAKSVVDYVCRYIGMKYLSPEDREEIFGVPLSDIEPQLVDPALVGKGGVEKQSHSDKILAELVSSSTIRTEGIGAKEQSIAQRVGNFGTGTAGNGKAKSFNADAPLCNNCGTIMIHAGSCYSCPNCFATTGVCN